MKENEQEASNILDIITAKIGVDSILIQVIIKLLFKHNVVSEEELNSEVKNLKEKLLAEYAELNLKNQDVVGHA